MAKAKTAARTIKVTLVRSPIGFPKPQKATVRALGLRRMNQTVEHADTPALRGMLAAVIHLIRIEE
ncbi:50S ribosomal protein L30 [bacterium]|nr:50S ribosomal protein L30 [bacterium]OIO83661.1 MAG: 50S ribosomal protein L30 [Anaerolineae bacterium CG2_30_58_95]PIU91362.1 MAG: 50S ribosomal protein L30 [Anaerolineae bacterium CG06_land_8_20_14_3_00_57_67]PIW20763.1 MAG: 50S ribosomal protein L30 [Anaerolineae bacterium CG17_big_fil_post_rev_8_21_14_2_50_57_27]PIX47817.1 MAG: 50S ribosomal protein L30 [Anaerolineae bacterium CG_4_8_14_3_um_filter_59_70]PJH74432.1 MAG: 50S ribosomal protein L30 [Anaerolineae bacterium CG_4_9_14_0_8_um_